MNPNGRFDDITLRVNDAYIVGVFFFNDTATTEIYTLSLHDALPIYLCSKQIKLADGHRSCSLRQQLDRKSTRLNSSHLVISYAVFCLKKKQNFRPVEFLEQISYSSLGAEIECGAITIRNDRDGYLSFFFLNKRAPTKFYPFPQQAFLPI